MQKKLTMGVDAAKHAAFKSKAAAQGVTMAEVLNAAIDAYLAGTFKPTRKAKAKP